jgi:putative ABC transport system permease protein
MQDLRLAVRALRATPVVTTAAVLSLALGIGANTAIFSLVNGLVLRALPVTQPQQLATVSGGLGPASTWSYPIWAESSAGLTRSVARWRGQAFGSIWRKAARCSRLTGST